MDVANAWPASLSFLSSFLAHRTFFLLSEDAEVSGLRMERNLGIYGLKRFRLFVVV